MNGRAADRAYRRILRRLVRDGLKFVVIGTYGVRLRLAECEGLDIHDCDLAVENSKRNVEIFVESMRAAGWALEVWGEELRLPLDYASLEGKYYIRGRKGRLVVDASYEPEHFTWPELEKNSTRVAGIPVAALDQILESKRLRGRPSDLELLERVRRIKGV